MKTELQRQFRLKKVCSNCPFLKNGKGIELEDGRLEEIVKGLLVGKDSTFHCHKTVYTEDDRNFDDDGNYVPIDVAHCPGAAAVCRKFGRDTVIVQLANRLGIIEENHFDRALGTTVNPEDIKINKREVHL